MKAYSGRRTLAPCDARLVYALRSPQWMVITLPMSGSAGRLMLPRPVR